MRVRPSPHFSGTPNNGHCLTRAYSHSNTSGQGSESRGALNWGKVALHLERASVLVTNTTHSRAAVTSPSLAVEAGPATTNTDTPSTAGRCLLWRRTNHKLAAFHFDSSQQRSHFLLHTHYTHVQHRTYPHIHRLGQMLFYHSKLHLKELRMLRSIVVYGNPIYSMVHDDVIKMATLSKGLNFHPLKIVLRKGNGK